MYPYYRMVSSIITKDEVFNMERNKDLTYFDIMYLGNPRTNNVNLWYSCLNLMLKEGYTGKEINQYFNMDLIK